MALNPFQMRTTPATQQPNYFQQQKAAEEERKRQAANLTKQEKYEQFALQNIQQKEEKALANQLKKSGFDENQIRQIIAKERQANAQELSGLRELQGGQAGYQASPYGDPFKGTVRSGMTFADTAPQIAQRIQAGYDYGTKVKAMQRFADKVGLPLGDAMRLSQLPTDRPVTVADVQAIGGAKHPAAVAKLANTLNSWGGGDIDATQLSNVKPVNGSPGVYQAKVKIRGGETVDGYFIRDEATGKFTNTANLYKHWNNKAGLGALGIVLAVGVGLLAGPIAGALESTLGSVGSQIAAGAITGGASSAIQGGDFFKGALTGGVGGAVGSLAGEALKGVTIGGKSLPAGVVRAGTSFARGVGSGIASGRGIGDSLKSGAIAGGAQALGDVAFGTKTPEDFGQRALTDIGRYAIGYGLNRAFAPTGGGQGSTSGGTSSGSATLGGAYAVPGASTQALSQALRTGDIGAPLFGSEGKEGRRKNVWNVASLKVKDEMGS